MRLLPVLCALGLALSLGCGDDDGGTTTEGSSSSGGSGTAGAGVGGLGSGAGGTSNGGSGGAGNDGGASAGGASAGGTGGMPPVRCDYEVDSGLLVIEAEDLPLPADWEAQSMFAGYTGSGYRVWTGASQNNNPGEGLVAVDLHIPVAGRYRLQWRNRIGMGSNTTEHNDTWLRFADVDGYYGLKITSELESRRYPKPLCDDDTAMAAIESDPMVDSATCPNGSTSDGWLKVYSSGANDWSWSTRTSDNDAHDIYIEVDAPGVYTMEIAARADFHLIDRIVLHEESMDNATAQDLGASPTPCP